MFRKTGILCIQGERRMVYYEIGYYGTMNFIPVKKVRSESKAVQIRDILQELAENDVVKLPDWVNESYPDLNIDEDCLTSVKRCKTRLVIEKIFENTILKPQVREKPRKIPRTQTTFEV